MFKSDRFSCASIVIFLALAIAPVRANPTSNAIEQKIPKIKFVPPEDGEEPETKGAGTRNPDEFRCSAEEPVISAIMPSSNYGLTTQTHPEIFVHLPQTSARQVVLSFQDREENYYEVAFLPIEQNAEVASFALPKDRPPLMENESYQWKLSLVCDDIPHVDDPIISGWVRLKPVPQEILNIKDKTTIAKAIWYGNNGYWYDLLQQIKLAQEQACQTESFTTIWQELKQQY